MDEFQMTAPVTGTYSVCFQNLPDSETSKDTKIVMLSVHVGVESILRNAASLKDAAVSVAAEFPLHAGLLSSCAGVRIAGTHERIV
jgi:hypothetical protein